MQEYGTYNKEGDDQKTVYREEIASEAGWVAKEKQELPSVFISANDLIFYAVYLVILHSRLPPFSRPDWLQSIFRTILREPNRKMHLV